MNESDSTDIGTQCVNSGAPYLTRCDRAKTRDVAWHAQQR